MSYSSASNYEQAQGCNSTLSIDKPWWSMTACTGSFGRTVSSPLGIKVASPLTGLLLVSLEASGCNQG